MHLFFLRKPVPKISAFSKQLYQNMAYYSYLARKVYTLLLIKICLTDSIFWSFSSEIDNCSQFCQITALIKTTG